MAPIPRANLGDLTEWQKRVNDDTLLSKLSLPGTHNSAASHISFPSVQCQGASVTEQLEHGVRFLDIRCAVPFWTGCGGVFGSSPGDLQVIHGNFPVKIPFPEKLDSVLKEVYDFVGKHKSESVVVSLKAEGAHKWEGDEFADIIWSRYVHPNEEKWYLKNKIPRMGECRGKVILFRRFGCNDDSKKDNYGINAQWWKYNCDNDNRENVAVQDWCEVMKPEDINQKVTYINDHIKRAVEFNSTSEADSNGKLYINFCSGSNFWNPQCWPRNVSKGVFDGVTDKIDRGAGVIIIDYAETNQWDFVRSMVALNFD
uniref:ARAD1C26994p n=1 Tax=Blastobotrys adeninivorans TaxID=409370 RepID=A0A060T285_BLAAD